VTVGFVGGVGLRKGAPYFFQAAKRFSPDRVKFVMLGGVQLNEKAVSENKGAVEIIPHAPRSEVAAWLAKFDLIYFPTTCEGSAYALMEAMATGLPIVTSPNSGTVARHDKEGYLCPYSDIDAAVGYIEKLASDENLRLDMGRAAAERYRAFDLANYVRQLQTLFRNLIGP
jgi:glycosyltransferase involved in cell wall biosynthesis